MVNALESVLLSVIAGIIHGMVDWCCWPSVSHYYSSVSI